MIAALFLMLAAVQAVPAASPPPPPPVSKAEVPALDARHAKALELAQLLASEDSVVRQNDDQYVKVTSGVLLAQRNMPELEVKYPGVIDAMARASLPVVEAQLQRRLPLLWDRLSDLYLANFTVSELDQAANFYSSPTGRKVITGLRTQMKADAVGAELRKDPRAAVSVGAVRRDVQATVPGILKTLTPKEQAALLAFSRTSTFSKIQSIGPQTQQLQITWTRETTPEETKEISDSMLAVLRARIAATKAVAQ